MKKLLLVDALVDEEGFVRFVLKVFLHTVPSFLCFVLGKFIEGYHFRAIAICPALRLDSLLILKK